MQLERLRAAVAVRTVVLEIERRAALELQRAALAIAEEHHRLSLKWRYGSTPLDSALAAGAGLDSPLAFHGAHIFREAYLGVKVLEVTLDVPMTRRF
jgi:hypothetical protein